MVVVVVFAGVAGPAGVPAGEEPAVEGATVGSGAASRGAELMDAAASELVGGGGRTPDTGSPGAEAGRWVLEATELESLRARALRRGLVDLRAHVPDVILDLRYALEDNVTGRRLYPENFPCFVNRGTATKVAAAAEYLAKRGRRLVVWDAFRPGEAQIALWRAAPDDAYVADPRQRLSNHCRGAALDVTLADGDGHRLRMPSAFDDFSERAASRYQGTDPAVRRNLALLREAMLIAGFVYIQSEWWHFHDPAATTRPALSAIDDLGLDWPAPDAPATGNNDPKSPP